MALWDRLRGRRHRRTDGQGPIVRGADAEDAAHLTEFVSTRRGVEGFIEPRTTVSSVTLLLVAHDGEWTRRRVPSEQWARKFASRQHIPAYDAGLVGIPSRMREYIRRNKEQEGPAGSQGPL